ncbi:MAG: AraC family transcriptional regulator [Clostridia bacterium]|nr:AraC family transcriptional regulator [Clostridia bacterium]
MEEIIEAYEEKDESVLEDIELVYQICDHPVLLTSAHYHKVIEIIYALENDFIVTVNDAQYTLHEGEMIIINAKETHSVTVMDYGMHRSVAIKFLPETICSDHQSLIELKYIIPYILSFSDFKTYYTKEEVENSNIKRYIENIMEEDRKREYAYKFAIRINVSHLVLGLLRKIHITNPLNEDITDEIRIKFSNIFQYISEHYAEGLTAIEISKMFGLRQSAFSAYFKKLTGKSFNEYLTYIRICKAKRMLIDTEKNISEIAYDIGFGNTSYFINRFQKQMGITPLNFKRLYQDPPARVYYQLDSNNIASTEGGEKE